MAGFFVQRVFPTLRILDAARARAFYVDKLGFGVDFEWHPFEGAPAFLQVSRDGLAVYLSEHEGDGTPGSVVYLYVESVDDWHAELERAGVEIEQAPRDQPWGNREMALRDPFGNQLRIATVRPLRAP
jgi:uncharacterized glyoxalase superfamily protein PhnB